MNTYLYFTDNKSAFILLSDYPKTYTDAQIVAKKEGKLHKIHFSRLISFKISNGTYMMSEELLMVLARAFNVEFEDLWNKVYMF